MKKVKPLLGFGPVGWIASAVLIGLLAAVFSGCDILYLYEQLISDCFGSDALSYYFAFFHFWHGISLPMPEFNLIAVLYVVIAFRIFPTRLGWWRYATVIAWGILGPLCWLAGDHLLRSVFQAVFGGSLSDLISFELFDAGVGIFTCILLLLVTRSWAVFAISLGATLLAHGALEWGGYWGISLGSPGQNHALTGGWHLCVSGSLIWWAIRARCNQPPETACEQCGYDLKGADHERCPECGAAVEPKPEACIH